ncbi:suppressor of fused domain protein [Rhodococcus sp. CH91]|uniref:suppressor of fused domain protein n=1 Tax=Rhodococcus sp. CH91 TaxID=2910256 RepID=UPI001F4AFC70|nr:suppressor of fused domain protein [Rhodococcus sp. CH91]
MTDAVLSAVRAHLTEHLSVPGGPDPESASVTFLGLEPIEVLRFRGGEFLRYATLGCSRHPMGDPTDMVADPTRGPRAELLLSLRDNEGITAGVHRTLAVLAALPAVEGVVLTDDALLDLGEPLWDGAPFTAVLLEAAEVPELELPEPSDPVRFFEARPITGTEAAWKRLKGTDALREAWQEAGIDLSDPRRAQARL